MESQQSEDEPNVIENDDEADNNVKKVAQIRPSHSPMKKI